MKLKFTKYTSPLVFLNENFDGLGDLITRKCESFIKKQFLPPLTSYYRSTTDATKQEPIKAINFLKGNFYDYSLFFIPLIEKTLFLIVKNLKRYNFQSVDFDVFQKVFLKLLERQYLKTLEMSGFLEITNNTIFHIHIDILTIYIVSLFLS